MTFLQKSNFPLSLYSQCHPGLSTRLYVTKPKSPTPCTSLQVINLLLNVINLGPQCHKPTMKTPPTPPLLMRQAHHSTAPLTSHSRFYKSVKLRITFYTLTLYLHPFLHVTLSHSPFIQVATRSHDRENFVLSQCQQTSSAQGLYFARSVRRRPAKASQQEKAR